MDPCPMILRLRRPLHSLSHFTTGCGRSCDRHVLSSGAKGLVDVCDDMDAGRVRVLAIASGGGHWIQLLRLRPAWEGCDVAYATTHEGYRKDVHAAVSGRLPVFHVVPDANRSQRARLVYQLVMVTVILLRQRPDVVVTTGASVGYFALRVAKYLGARTIWVDSIANAEEMSLSGQRAQRYADLWLTQWPELACSSGRRGRQPEFRGSVV